MSKSTQLQLDSSILAVLHRAGGTWRVLIASARNGGPALVETAEFPQGDAGRIEDLLQRHRVGRVICVVPAASVICRTCTLLEADAEQLHQALRLLAEAHLLGHAPEHRLAMSVLPAAAGETSRSGIILAWPESARIDIPPTPRPMTFAPDLAAVAALLDGLRPADPLLWLDRAGGSVALAVTHANGAVFRGTREEASSPEDWRQRVRIVLAETAFSGGHTVPFVESLVQAHEPVITAVAPGEAALIMPQEIIDRASLQLEGAQVDAAWWSKYGIAAGVLLAATGEFSALTTLLDAPAVEKPSRIIDAAVALSRPRNATLTVIACLLILALAPLAASGLRLWIIKLRHPDIATEVKLSDRHELQLAMYDALSGEAWSAAKLLSDIVCNAPEGMTLDSIHLNRLDDSFSVRGEVMRVAKDNLEATDVASLMMDRLNESGIFGPVSINWGKANNFGTYQFDLSAKILQPHRRHRYGVELDYGRYTLAERREGKPPPAPETIARAPAGRTTDEPDESGEGTSEEPPKVASAPEERPSGDSQRSGDGGSGPGGHMRPGGGGPGGPGETYSDPDRRAPGAIAPGEIPEELTQAQVAAMSVEEVREHLTKVAEARRRIKSTDDEELKDRLKAEQAMLMQRLRELR